MSRLDGFIRREVMRGRVKFGAMNGRFAHADNLELVKNVTDRWHLITGKNQIPLSILTSLCLDIARAYASPHGEHYE